MGVREREQVEQKNVSDDVCRDDDEAADGGAEAAGDDGAVVTPCCGTGRAWVFLVLGFLAMVFSAALSGIYVNLGWLTSSMDGLGALPAFVPAAVSGTTGLLISLLCWKRYKILTYAAVVFCAVAVVLSAAAAVLTSMNLLQPLLSVSKCEYSRSSTECRCSRFTLSQNLQLEEGNNDGKLYLTLAGMMGCEDVHRLLPRLLYIVIGLYGVITLVCMLAGVISTLVYRTESSRSHVQHRDQQDQYSPLSSVSSREHDILLTDTATSQPHTAALFNTYTSPQMPTHRYTSIHQFDDETDSINDGDAAITDPASKPAVSPTGPAACKPAVSLTQSFCQPQPVTLQESRVRELVSCQAALVADGDRASHVNFTRAEQTTATLKEHRRKGRRAVTLHGLDRDQLLLILRLHMRYLQESDQQAHTEDENNGVHNLHTSLPSVNQNLLNNKHATGEDLDYWPAKLGRPQPGKGTHEYSPQLPSPSQSLSEQPKPLSPGRYVHDVSLSPGRYVDDVFQIGRHDFSSSIQIRPAESDNVLSSLTCCHPAISAVSNKCSEMGCTRNIQDSPARPSLTHADTLATTGTSAEAADKVQPLGTDCQHSHNSQSRGLHHTSQTSWPTQSDQQTSSSHVRKLSYAERYTPSDQEFSRHKAGTLSKQCNLTQIKPRSLDLHRPAVNSHTLESERWHISTDVGSSKVLGTPCSPGHSRVLPEFSHQTPCRASDGNCHASLVSHQTPCRASDGNRHDTSLLSELGSSPAEDSLELRQSLAANTGHFIESTPGKQLLLSNVPPFLQELTNSKLNTKHMTDFCSPPQHMFTPPQHMFTPPQHMFTPPQHMFTPPQHMFTPISRSSAEIGSNHDQICSPGHNQHSTPSHGQTSAHSNISQAATEASRRTEHRFEPPFRKLKAASDSTDHQLRQSCDQTQMDAVHVNFQGQSASETLSERLHPFFIHEQTRTSQKELEDRSAPDRSSSSHHMYAQAPRRSRTNGTSLLDMTDGSHSATHPHTGEFQPDAGHCNSGHQNLATQPNINTFNSRQSAFCVIGGSRKSGTSFGSCAPEVAAIHEGPHSARSPGWQTDHPPLSLPAHVQGDMSLQWGARQPGSRSVSTSSCEPWSTSHTQASTSDSWLAHSRGNLPRLRDRIHGGNLPHVTDKIHGGNLPHLTDRIHGGNLPHVTDRIHEGNLPHVTDRIHGGNLPHVTDRIHGGNLPHVTDRIHGGNLPHLTDRIHGGNRQQARFATQANKISYQGANQSPYQGANQSPYQGANQSPHQGANQSPYQGANQSPHHRFYTLQYRNKHQEHWQWEENQNHQQAVQGSSQQLLHVNNEVPGRVHRQRSANIRRCQSLAERHQPRPADLRQRAKTRSLGVSQQQTSSNKLPMSSSHAQPGRNIVRSHSMVEKNWTQPLVAGRYSQASLQHYSR